MTLHWFLSKVTVEKEAGRNTFLEEKVGFPPTVASMDYSPATNHASCSLKGYNSHAARLQISQSIALTMSLSITDALHLHIKKQHNTTRSGSYSAVSLRNVGNH